MSERPVRQGLQVGTMVRPILLASFAVIFPVRMQAQARGMMPAASHPVTLAPRAVAHAAQPTVPQTMPAARIAVRLSAPRPRATPASTARITGRRVGTRRDGVNEATTTDFIPVPGLGCDMTHLAATRGPEAVGAGGHRHEAPV